MSITERQKSILEKIIEEYIDSATPISSQRLSQKYDFPICPASLRIEMDKLTKQGFLEQPFISSGRVPTDKAYRFFVDIFLEEDGLGENDFLKNLENIEGEMASSFNLFHSLTKAISEMTSNLAVSYLPEKELVFKEGWSGIAKEPEFMNIKKFADFIELIENWEQDVFKEQNWPKAMQIWIGKENPYSESGDFSAISCQYLFPDGEKGIMAIFGPKRMAYNKNIKILNFLNKKINDIRKTSPRNR